MARKTRILRFPFWEGQHEEFDAKMLPEGYLSRARNVRLRKDGRFGVRYGFTQLASTLYNGLTLSAQAVFSLRGRLFCQHGFTIVPRPLDFAEYVNTAAAWHGTTGQSFGVILPPLSDLRDVAGEASTEETGDRISVAVGGGYALTAQELATAATCRVTLTRISDGATLVTGAIAGSRPRCVHLPTGNVFLLAIQTSATAIDIRVINPSTATTLPASVNTLTAGAALSCWDFAAETPGTNAFLARVTTAPVTSLIRLDAAGATLTTITGAAESATRIAVYSDATNVLYVRVGAANAIIARTYAVAGGAAVAGPTTMFGVNASTTQPGISFESATNARVLVEQAVSTYTAIRQQSINLTTHALGLDTLFSTGHRLAARAIGQVTTGANRTALYAECRPRQKSLATFDYMLSLSAEAWGSLERFASSPPNADHLPNVCVDSSTGKIYWPRLARDSDNRLRLRLTESTPFSTNPRAIALNGADAYVAGGVPKGFDSRYLWESGFVLVPVILTATPSNTGPGALPSSVTLQVAVTFEYYDADGNFHTSAPSTIETVAMGAADDTIDLTVANAHTQRTTGSAAGVSGSVRVVAWRSSATQKQLRRCESVSTGPAPSAPLILTLTLSDAAIAANEVLYTQGQRGAFSGPIPHESPEPFQFVCRYGLRLLAAGLTKRRRAQLSKELFPGEPVNWSGEESHYVEAKDDIVGVASLDLRGILFGRSSIGVFTGDGPNDINEGEFSQVVDLPTSVGLYDARSLLEVPDGILFQASPDSIFLLPRGGGAPIDFARPVEDTLAAFPVITAAVLLQTEQVAVFCCNNVGLTTSKLVCYDLRAKTWTVDEFSTNFPIAHACEWQGRLVVVSGGNVFVQDVAFPGTAFLDHLLRTGPVRIVGWGRLIRITFLGEYRGDCVLTARISYDSGKTFTTLAAFSLLAANGLVAGDEIRRQWTPRRQKGQAYIIEFTVTTAGGASEGLVFNEYLLELARSEGSPRLPAGQKG